MFFAHVAHDCLIKIISGNLDGSADNDSSKRNNSDVGCSSSDVHDHISAWLCDIDSGADGCRNRFFNNGYFPCTCLVGRILNCLFLYFRGTARHTHADARLPSENRLSDGAVDEVA